jgi:phospho-N-acetylmuramoyl-pentapeptide-transferase
MAAVAVWYLLPKFWKSLPGDRGKIIAADGGVQSLGKPTGAGLHFSIILLPILILVIPLNPWIYGVLATLYMAMLFGYLDDCSKMPWGEWKKGILDLVVAALTSISICHGTSVEVWLPFYKGFLTVSPFIYVPLATCLLWFSMNATNCSDGVDGLAGSLTLLSLFALGFFLYGVVGYRPIANYLLVPHNAEGAAWAILVATTAGALAGYLWHNAEPSKVLMGDAGSRLLGLLVGVAVLISGNPFLIFVVSPVVLANGGTGLLKLILLRLLRRLGFDITAPTKLDPKGGTDQKLIVRTLHMVTFPLHDHCRKKLKWSNAQVLLRFVLIQAFLIPVLFVILMKIR